MKRATFSGYERSEGVGIRNHVLVLPTVICSSMTATSVANRVQGAVAIYNQDGCGQAGKDLERVASTLIGFGRNVNVSSVLVIALGCEALPFQRVADEIAGTGKATELLVIQDERGTTRCIEKGIKIARRMSRLARAEKRRRFDVSELVVGVECGGSDWTSGLASNPAVGRVADRIVNGGGRAIFSETPEILGAEHILVKRVARSSEAEKLLRMVENVERRAKSLGVDLRGTQPTPGNIAGGITTIEEKSLGAIHKAGNTQIRAALEYASRIPRESGLYFMDTPGHDIESVTGMVAGGANLILFTTGRGTPTGNAVAPVIKVTGNSETFTKMRDNIDLNVGTIVEGKETLDEAASRILSHVLKVASGRLSKAELLRHWEFAMHMMSPSF